MEKRERYAAVVLREIEAGNYKKKRHPLVRSCYVGLEYQWSITLDLGFLCYPNWTLCRDGKAVPTTRLEMRKIEKALERIERKECEARAWWP